MNSGVVRSGNRLTGYYTLLDKQFMSEIKSFHFFFFQAFANQVNVLKDQEASIRRGLNIFKIEQQNSKSLQNIEKDIGYLEQVIH